MPRNSSRVSALPRRQPGMPPVTMLVNIREAAPLTHRGHPPATKFLGNVLGKAGFLYMRLEESPHTGKQEARMINLAIRLVTLAMFSMALIAAPAAIPAFAAGGGGGGDPPASSPPPDSKATNTTHKS